MDNFAFYNDMGLIKRDAYVHTSSDAAKNSLFYLQETGTLQANSLHKSSRENMDSYLFFIVQAGSGMLEYSGTSNMLSEGDCVFIDCHEAYEHSTQADSWTLKWAHFNGLNMDRIYREYLSCGGKNCFQSENFGKYQEILMQLRGIKRKDMQSLVKDMKIHVALSQLLAFLLEDAVNSKMKRNLSSRMPEIKKVKKYLDQNYTSKISLDDLSRSFFINKYYMLETFKEYYGYTINEYLIHRRIDKAKSLLQSTDDTMDQIGYRCGMGGGSYFSRIFKKIEGVSPGKFRRMWQEK